MIMAEKEKIAFQEKLKNMPEEHPFECAKLCRLYCYDDTPTYVTNPAYDAFTYPDYDRDNMSFNYRHYDMEAETADDISVDLIELLEAYIDDDFVKAIEICNMFNVPMEQIKQAKEELLKLCNSCDEV